MAETKKTLVRFGGKALAGFVRHVVNTSKIISDPPNLADKLRDAHPCIVACWHGQFMMISALRPLNIRVAAMVARHGDAELISETLRAIDVELIRGAGAGERKRDRGGAAALRASLRALANGSSLVMTADVPPGPARVAGAGIITIGRMSGRPIVPIAVATKHFASFDTWSRITVNLPYSNLAFVVGDPIEVPHDADDAALEVKRLELEAIAQCRNHESLRTRGRRSTQGHAARPACGDVSARAGLGTQDLPRRDLAAPARRTAVAQRSWPARQGGCQPARRAAGFRRPSASGRSGRLDACGERRRNERHPSTYRGPPRCQSAHPRPADDRHDDVCRHRRQPTAGPGISPIHSARRGAVRRAISRSLETGTSDFHGIRYLAEPRSRNGRATNSTCARQRQNVAAEHQPLAQVRQVRPTAVFALCGRACAECPGRACHQAPRGAEYHHRGQHQDRLPAATRRSFRARKPEERGRRPPRLSGGQHASRRGHA